MNKKINILYSLSQGLYWMIYCVFIGYASVYLLGNEYSNTNIGFLMAIGYLFSIFVQQLVASLADSSEKLKVTTLIVFTTILLFASSVFLFFLKTKSFLMSFIYIMICILLMLLQPLLNSVNFFFIHHRINMNFGIARSIGSLFYAIISSIIGIVILRYDIIVIPLTGCFLVLLMIIVTSLLFYEGKKLESIDEKIKKETTSFSLSDFICKYNYFFLFLIGSLGLFFSHTIINNYFYQIVTSVNGTSSDLGNIQAFSAILELPAMFFFSKLYKRFGCKKLLTVSSIFFSIKIIITFFSFSVSFLYVSMICQMFAFAIFIPTSVYFVDEVIDANDAVKGQAFVTGMITLANLISSLCGGIIIDNYSVQTMLVCGVMVAILGAIIVLISLSRIYRKKVVTK